MSAITKQVLSFYNYDITAVKNLLQTILYNHAPAGQPWLEEKAQTLNEAKNNTLAVAFSAMPRKVGRQLIIADEETSKTLNHLKPGFSVWGWTVDRLGRVWLLLQVDASDKETYIRRIESLFPAAEMNELVALYSALPLLAYPETWRSRCAEGIRSNIGPVLETIICNNAYAAQQLDERAWNQLVLKAFFTDKRVDQISGLDERANTELSNTLLDFAHERWAAGRQVPPLLWRCVAPFFSSENMPDLERAFYSENSFDRDAAALACAQTHFAPAKALLEKRPDAKAEIENGVLTWTSLAEKIAAAQA